MKRLKYYRYRVLHCVGLSLFKIGNAIARLGMITLDVTGSGSLKKTLEFFHKLDEEIKKK